MQTTDSDFTLNDWRRRLGRGGAVLYCLIETEGLLKITDSHVHPKSCVEIVTYFLQCAVEWLPALR